MSDAVSHVRAAEASNGARGETDHVSGAGFSLHTWNLRDLARSATHTNDYALALYVVDGLVSVYDADGTVNEIRTGDSVLIPAGTNYSMAAEHADAVETRIK